MKHDTEIVNQKEYPAPDNWSVNWVEGDVISWRYDPTPAAEGDVHGTPKIHDGPVAHVFAHFPNEYGPVEHRVEVDGETVANISPDDSDTRDDVFDAIGDVLAEHTPD